MKKGIAILCSFALLSTVTNFNTIVIATPETQDHMVGTRF